MRKILVMILLFLVTPVKAECTVSLTAKAGGYYKVYVDQVVDAPSHTAEREAIEHAMNILLSGRTGVVEISHDYLVDVQLGGEGCAPEGTLLSWELPATRTNGASLSESELDWFRIYHGDTQDMLVMTAEVKSPLNTYQFPAVVKGFFAVTATDTDGLESEFSNIVEKQ